MTFRFIQKSNIFSVLHYVFTCCRDSISSILASSLFSLRNVVKVQSKYLQAQDCHYHQNTKICWILYFLVSPSRAKPVTPRHRAPSLRASLLGPFCRMSSKDSMMVSRALRMYRLFSGALKASFSNVVTLKKTSRLFSWCKRRSNVEILQSSGSNDVNMPSK